MSATPKDLTPKGQARHDALLDAVLRVLERDGASAVTHRAVAAEAGVPVASATYYFATIDDLLVSALRRGTAQLTAMLGGLEDTDVAGWARIIHRYTHRNRAATVAQYELMFLAMRRESLRADAQAWYGALERAIDPQNLHPERTRVTALAIDGLLLKMLWLGTPSTVEGTEQALREIVGR